MQLRDITLGSLLRRPTRAAFVVGALALGVGTLVAMVSLTQAMRTDLGDELDRFGANIVITPKSTVIDLAYGGATLGGVTVDGRDLQTTDAAKVRTIPNARNISAVAPKLIGTTEVNGARVVLVGIVPRDERGLKGWWTIDGTWAAGPGDAMLGTEVAQRLSLRPGDRVQVGAHDLRVTGVVHATGGLDDHAIFADLGLVQAVLDRPHALTLVEVSALCRGCPIEDIVAQIAQVLPDARVTPIRQAVAAREEAVGQMTRFAWLVSILVLCAAALVVSTTMLASVMERTQEIGILRAVGFRQSHVVRVILLEVSIIGLLGGLFGFALGASGAHAFGRFVAQLSTPAQPSLWLAAGALCVSVVLGLASGIYPALRAARLDPAQAFRQL